MFARKIYLARGIFGLAALSFVSLTGCSDDANTISSTLVGAYSSCEAPGTGASSRATYQFNDSTLTISRADYVTADCSGATNNTIQSAGTYTLNPSTLGADSFNIDINFTSGYYTGRTFYHLIRSTGAQIQWGDISAQGAPTTANLRPTAFSSPVYTK